MTLLLVHVAATVSMVGVIWIIQLVHYPLFAGVGEAGFAAYQHEHSRRITWVVAPAMLTEAATGVALGIAPPGGVPAWAAWLGVGAIAAVWMATWLLAVPQHRRLARGFDRDAHHRLVATNWVRTALWSGRGLLVLWMVSVV